jgi:hypothetical protein
LMDSGNHRTMPRAPHFGRPSEMHPASYKIRLEDRTDHIFKSILAANLHIRLSRRTQKVDLGISLWIIQLVETCLEQRTQPSVCKLSRNG